MDNICKISLYILTLYKQIIAIIEQKNMKNMKNEFNYDDNFQDQYSDFKDYMDPEQILENSKIMAKANLTLKYYTELLEKQLEKNICEDPELTNLYNQIKKLEN